MLYFTDAVFPTSERTMSCVKLALLLVLAFFPSSIVRKLLRRLIAFRFVLAFIRGFRFGSGRFGCNHQVLDVKRKERSVFSSPECWPDSGNRLCVPRRTAHSRLFYSIARFIFDNLNFFWDLSLVCFDFSGRLHARLFVLSAYFSCWTWGWPRSTGLPACLPASGRRWPSD